MENNNDAVTLVSGIILFLTGSVMIIKRIMIIRKNKIITGEIYDRSSCFKDSYYPVIKYRIEDETMEYQSSHYSILQKIGRKIRLVYNEKEKWIIGTLGEMFFIPVNITIVGLFIMIIMLLYKYSK